MVLAEVVLSSAGYLYFGIKEYSIKAWKAGFILVLMTLIADICLAPYCREFYEEFPIVRMLCFTYGGALSYIQLGMLYMVKGYETIGRALTTVSVVLPSLLVVIGMGIGRVLHIDEYKKQLAFNKKEKSEEYRFDKIIIWHCIMGVVLQ